MSLIEFDQILKSTSTRLNELVDSAIDKVHIIQHLFVQFLKYASPIVAVLLHSHLFFRQPFKQPMTSAPKYHRLIYLLFPLNVV